MRTWLAIITMAALAGAGRGEPPSGAVDYLVAPAVGANGLEAIAVTIRLAGDFDGETELTLPDRWAGSERLHEAVSDLSVDGGTLAATGDSARRTVTHAPGAALTVRYRVAGIATADPSAEYEKARPVLRPAWFYVHGEGLFVTPGERGDAPARFRWAATPEGWRLASSLDAYPAAALTVDGVAQSILIGGGDLRVIEREVGGRPVRIALRGDWPFADDAFADALARVIAAGNAWMSADAAPYFVPLIPLTGAETGAISFGGTGRTGGFALSSTANVGFDDIVRLLAHEYGHRWFGGSLGPLADPGAPEYWFTEGFGDFVAARTLVGGGLWTEADYAAHLNRVLLRYHSSSARTMANAALAERFWDDPDAMQMPYDRGHLFALALDGAEPGSVRAALLIMAREPAMFPAEETQAARFVRVHGAGRLDAMLAGEPIVLPANLFAACGSIEWAEQPIYATGYTTAEDAAGRYFASVDEASPAWAAGLRPGMRYLRRISFRPADATVPIVMRVADAAGERVLRWLPEGRERVRFQRLALSDFADDAARDACRAELVG